ncbi:hypothetical protein ACIG54_33505 [Streptomyces achromogenes]|uniref:hypothetical protein n=1 Tax=Streptomyces achromogenes TaxID=67255 RepID=UPI0037D8C2F7
MRTSLAREHRHGHEASYDGLNQGRIDVAHAESTWPGCVGLWSGCPLPRAADGRIVSAVHVSPWLRPDANADWSLCRTFGRGEGKHRMAPRCPYSVVAALETGRASWTAVLGAVRLEPGADVAAVIEVRIRKAVK